MKYVACDRCDETVPMNSPEGIQFTFLTRFDIKYVQLVKILKSIQKS